MNSRSTLEEIAELVQPAAFSNDLNRKIWADFIRSGPPMLLGPALRQWENLPEFARGMKDIFSDIASEERIRHLLPGRVKNSPSVTFGNDSLQTARRQRVVLASMFHALEELARCWPREQDNSLRQSGWQLDPATADELSLRILERFRNQVEEAKASYALLEVKQATFRDFLDRLTLGDQAADVPEMEALFPIYFENAIPGEARGCLFQCMASPRFRYDGEIFLGLNGYLRRDYTSDLLRLFPRATKLVKAAASELGAEVRDIRIRFEPLHSDQDVCAMGGKSMGGAVLAASLRAALQVPLRRRQVYSMELPEEGQLFNRFQQVDKLEEKIVIFLNDDIVGQDPSKFHHQTARFVVTDGPMERRIANLCQREDVELLSVATPMDLLRKPDLRQEFFLPQTPPPVPQYFQERPQVLERLVRLLEQKADRSPLVLLRGERSAGKSRLWSRCYNEIFSGRLVGQYEGGILLDLQNDQDIAALFLSRFNELLERHAKPSLNTRFGSDYMGKSTKERISALLGLLADTQSRSLNAQSRYMVVLENLEAALHQKEQANRIANDDLKQILHAIAEHPASPIQVLALSTKDVELPLEWAGRKETVELGDGTLPWREAASLLKVVGEGHAQVKEAEDGQLETMLRRLNVAIPFDVLLIAAELRNSAALPLKDYQWSGRTRTIEHVWEHLNEEDQVALRLIAIASPINPSMEQLADAVVSILGKDRVVDFAALHEGGLLLHLLQSRTSTEETQNEIASLHRNDFLVSMPAEVQVFVEREEEKRPLSDRDPIARWGMKYFADILGGYNERRTADLSILAFLNFEEEEFITAAGRWLWCISHVDDLERARIQWLTFVLRTFVWWGEYTAFKPTEFLLKLWLKTPFYQRGDDRLSFELMDRFLKDYPRGSEWQTRERDVLNWVAALNSLKRLLIHLRLDGPYPGEDQPELRHLRTMIDDYKSEAMWYAHEDGAEEVYLESIEAYWGDRSMAWIAPFNHTELAEFYLSQGYTALALRQCRIALRRGAEENEWGGYPVAPKEPETLFWIYRVLSDTFWQCYTCTGEEAYVAASIGASQLSAWYAFVFQSTPHDADEYTVLLAEEAYMRSLHRLRDAAHGNPAELRRLGEKVRSFWQLTDESRSLLTPYLPALDIERLSDEEMRLHIFPRPASITEDGRREYGRKVNRVAQDKAFIKQTRASIKSMRKALPDAISKFAARPMLHRLTSPQDRYAADFLDLFQQSFPPEEQIRLSEVWAGMGRLREESFLEVVLGPEPEHRKRSCQGILWTEVNRAGGYVTVWYFAIKNKGQGSGSRVWTCLEQRWRTAGLRAIVWEVERPDQAAGPIAARRIRFYRRLTGQLTDADYLQHVGWRPPTPMHLMIQPLVPLTVQQQRRILKSAFGKDLKAINDVDVPFA